MKIKSPILLTAADRSGSSIVAKVLVMCGAFTGNVNVMYEHSGISANLRFTVARYGNVPFMPEKIKLSLNSWSDTVSRIIRDEEGYTEEKPVLIKQALIAQTWSMWHDSFPDAKWVIVRRRTGDVVSSCKETAYMTLFKEKANRDKINVRTEEKGWLWWVHQYEQRFIQITQNTPNVKFIWAERMATGDFEQMKEVVEWVGLEWNPEVEKIIPNLLRKP